MNFIQKVANYFQIKRFHDIMKMWGDYTSLWLRNMTRTDYLKEYKGWVYAAVSTISSRVGVLDFHLLDEKEKPIDHEYLKFITYDLLESISSFIKLNGSCYVWKVMVGRRVLALQVLRPDLMQPVYDSKWSKITGYKYSVKWKEFKFPAEEIIAFHNFNPLQAYPFVTQWIGDVQAAAIAIDTDNAASTWNWKFFENNAAPWFGLSTEWKLDDATYERVKSSWENKYKWVNNSHKVAIFEGGLKPVNLAPSQREMDFVDQRRYSRDEILGIFKVPKACLGLGEGSSQNLNIQAFEIQLATNAIQPLAIKIEEALSIGLFWGIGYFEFVNVIPKDSAEVRSDFEIGWITLNEFRSARWYRPVSNGDVFKTDQPTVTITGKPDPKKSAFEWLVKWIIEKNTKGTEEYNQGVLNRRDKRLEKHEKKMKTIISSIFDKQQQDILSRIKKDIKVIIPQLDTGKYKVLYASLLKNVYIEIYDEEWTASMKELGVDTAFKIGDPEVREIRDTIANWGNSVDSTTNKAIRDTMAEAIDKGEDVVKMIARLKSVFGNIKESRLETIARTESINASTNATLMAWKQSKVVTWKEWWTDIRERTCPLCRSLNGKTIWLSDNFFNKWDTLEAEWETMKFDYRDINWPALHPRCRCVLLPITK
jgi:HK97 family phage portal protein